MDKEVNKSEIIGNKIINRLFSTLIILFFATPFIFFFYGQLLGNAMGIDFKELLESNIYLNITFTTSFITPFIGYYLLLLKQKLAEGEAIEFVLLKLSVVAISFLVMSNATYALFLSILTFFMFKEWQVTIKKLVNYIKEKNWAVKDWLSTGAILIVAIVIRIMLIKIGSL